MISHSLPEYTDANPNIVCKQVLGNLKYQLILLGFPSSLVFLYLVFL